jgi:hypothetical protein
MDKKVERNDIIVIATKTTPRYQIFTVTHGKALICRVNSKRMNFRWVDVEDCLVVGFASEEDAFREEET